MQAVKEPPLEVIHIYYEREEEKKPYTALPLFFAFLMLCAIGVVTLYSAMHPSYEHETLTIRAHFFTRTFTAIAPIIPTGRMYHPATNAHGILTITNGSILSGELPQGFIVTGQDGVEVVTDEAVFIPAGSANGYGVATVSAHAVRAGEQGNMRAGDIDALYGTAIYIRNLQSFTGGMEAFTTLYATEQDKQNALDHGRSILTKTVNNNGFLPYPCKEVRHTLRPETLQLTWICQFASYAVPSHLKVTHVRLVGNTFFVDVILVAQPRNIWGR